MDADRIVKLSPEAIHELIESQQIPAQAKHAGSKRQHDRWPFAGTIEVWLPESCYGERHVLATLHNLSQGGLAMRARRPIPSGTNITLAIHLPALSSYGHAVVRHCTRAAVGYLVGVEFMFPEGEATPSS